MGRFGVADAWDGRRPRHRSGQPRLVPGCLGDDDGGDDAALAAADDPALRPGRPTVGRRLPTSVFVASYFAVWTAYGVAAFALYRAGTGLHPAFLAWNRAGPYLAGGSIALAGLYELTPLKSVCLRHCRSPLHYVLGGWRPGIVGAVRMGVEHGGYCVGCCWGLMLLLFALGVMSLFWMAVVAALIFAQKVLPFGLRTTRLFALAFLALALWVAVSPATVPQLTQPNSNAAVRARMQMNMKVKPDARTGMPHPSAPMTPK